MQPYRIGFIGGSITMGACATTYEKTWVSKVFAGIRTRFPERECECYNAAISGTGSQFGVFRVKDDLLRYAPDVVFVEFAVNDVGTADRDPQSIIDSMDDMIRQIMCSRPAIPVILVYTATRDLGNAAAVHAKVAANYGLPEIDVAAALLERVNAGEPWDAFLMPDGVHPNDAGHALYAETVLRTLDAHPEYLTTPPRPAPSMASMLLHRPTMLPAERARLLDGFRMVDVDDDHEKIIDVMNVRRAAFADTAGSVLEFDFSGRAFGLYHSITRNGGRIHVEIDGQDMGDCGCHWGFENDYREFVAWYIRTDLPDGSHTARLTVTAQEGYERIHCAVAGFLVEQPE